VRGFVARPGGVHVVAPSAKHAPESARRRD
jgi:hypothetical protein